MMVYAPPGTAVHYASHQGWTRDTYKLTQLVDIGNWLVWAKTKDGQENTNRPEPEWRPGDPIPGQGTGMTVGDYMRMSGFFEIEDE